MVTACELSQTIALLYSRDRPTLLTYCSQLNEGHTAIFAILDVLPFWLINDGRLLGKFKQSLRFDVIHHFVAPFLVNVSERLCRLLHIRRITKVIAYLLKFHVGHKPLLLLDLKFILL
jgi:hypothetical protein